MAQAIQQDSALREQLIRGAQSLGIALDDAMVERLLAYLSLLSRWNKHYNLTRIQEPAQMVSGHLLDSLSVLPWIRPARVLDVGAGAGLPGIPLAICRPDWEVVLLDSNSKKTRFLNQVKIELKLNHVQVVHGRVEAWRDAAGFDTVMCRALTQLKEFVDKASHLCRSSGIMVAMKGQYPAQELDVIRASGLVCSVERVVLPDSDIQRHLVIIEHPENQS